MPPTNYIIKFLSIAKKINTQKFDDISLTTFKMFIILLVIKDNTKKSRFFEKKFLVYNFRINIILEILFFTLSNMKEIFLEFELFLRI